MGQILIDIPNKTNRRYTVSKSGEARELLRILDGLLNGETDSSQKTRQQIQDLRDGLRADEIVAETRRTGETYSTRQLRDEFGLS